MSNQAPVSACLIIKNEAGQIESCLKSIRPHVKEIVVVDTGSTDGTQGIVKPYVDVFEQYGGCNGPDGKIASFSDAREKSLSLATQPWIFWVDGDDEVVGADRIPGIVDQFSGRENPVMVMFPYNYSHDARGNVTCRHYRERLVSPRTAFEWKGPVHEVLSPKQPCEMVQTDEVTIVHRRAAVAKPVEENRNLRILKKYYDEIGDNDARQLYYLGLEYANSGDLGTSISFHKKYVEKSGWDDEKCLACLEISRHYQTLAQYEDAAQWAQRAVMIKERWGETYFALGRSYYYIAQRGGPDARRNWERAANFIRIGLEQSPTQTVLFVNPTERTYDVHKYLNLALNNIGDVHGALESCVTALKVNPDDEGLKLNAALYEEHLAKLNVEEGVAVLERAGKIGTDAAHIMRQIIHGRFEVKPLPVDKDAAVPAAAGPSVEVPGDGLDIALYVGPGVEPWNPSTFERGGMGGSETMAWEISRRLAKKGHKIRLYGDCQQLEGVFEGVRFIHHEKFRDVRCDVLVTSRRPHVVDDAHGLEARARVCWIHDIHCGNALNHARSVRLDRILCLSNWHRQTVLDRYKFLHPDQVIITRNGIDLSRFEGSENRNPHRMVFSSSPDRGLQVAVDSMPRIRERVPDAELHVFYGFKTWEVAARSANDSGQLNLIEMLRQKLRDHEKHGVVFHDRIGQVGLAREFMRSGVWGYPTWFSETSCITAMEAQAAGLRIVTSPIAALNETVGDRGLMIRDAAGGVLDWLHLDYMAKFVDGVVDAMTREGDADRDVLKNYAQTHFGLDALADEWDAMLSRILKEVSEQVVVPYQAAV